MLLYLGRALYFNLSSIIFVHTTVELTLKYQSDNASFTCVGQSEVLPIYGGLCHNFSVNLPVIIKFFKDLNVVHFVQCLCWAGQIINKWAYNFCEVNICIKAGLDFIDKS